MTAAIPDLVFNNSVTMPALGFGVFQSPPGETAAAVETALTVGYRHIDTAAAYGNERQVGEAIGRSGLDRDDVFIETKVWVSDYGYDQTLHAFDKAIRKLGIEQLDLLILHQPAPDRFDKTIAASQALETLLTDGKVRSIGVSNFMRHHLDELLRQTGVVPAVNQIELHPRLTQPELRSYHSEHGIATEAWSPIGQGESLSEESIVALAQKYGRTPAQLVLRWHIQVGNIVFPKSSNRERIAENIDIFDFELADDDVETIEGLNANKRRGPNPDTFGN
jgi:diketogulonate reductase-like aldo/keto reductase